MKTDPIAESRRLRQEAARARQGLGAVVDALIAERSRAQQVTRAMVETVQKPRPPTNPRPDD